MDCTWRGVPLPLPPSAGTPKRSTHVGGGFLLWGICPAVKHLGYIGILKNDWTLLALAEGSRPRVWLPSLGRMGLTCAPCTRCLDGDRTPPCLRGVWSVTL